MNPWRAITRALYHGDFEEATTAIELCFWEIEPLKDGLLMQRPGRKAHKVFETCDCPGYSYRQDCAHKRAFELIQRYSEVE